MDFAPGTQVTDKVRLVDLLGQGGMGSVWVADHLSLRTRVAVKFLSADLVKKDPNMRERFNREAALSAQIKSPHVVQIFDHGVMEDGHPYIVMELLDGETLAQRLERDRILSLAHAKLVISQTAKALMRAHKLGIVHRDIKPDNIFLTVDEDEELFVKVLDFGIAKQVGLPKVSAVTGTGMMVGTPEYMSPEQVLSARNVDLRSDLWALGVVSYHCLTGGVPFSGETLGSLCVAIANGEFVPPSRYRRELPPSIDEWFRRALSKEPTARFDSAKEMAAAFSSLLGSGESPLSMSDSADASGGHVIIRPSNPGAQVPPNVAVAARSAAALAKTTPVGAPRPAMPGVDEPTTGGVQLYTPPPAHQGPTFAGATLSRERSGRGGRRLAFILVALVAAAGAGAAGFFLLPGPERPVAEPEPAPEKTTEPAATTEPATAATEEVEEEPSATVAPVASSAPEPPVPPPKTAPRAVPKAVPKAAPKPAPPPKPSASVAPTPQNKDRGF
jgi:serine/threonine-protein kinase